MEAAEDGEAAVEKVTPSLRGEMSMTQVTQKGLSERKPFGLTLVMQRIKYGIFLLLSGPPLNASRLLKDR